MTDEEFDALILSHCTPERRKVAYFVGLALGDIARAYPPRLDDLYIANRVKALVAPGRLRGWGDLDQMRFSEVASPG